VGNPAATALTMAATVNYQDSGIGSPDELKGLDILLVEDSRDVGDAVKMLLELCGAHVDGPATNTAEAEGLLAAHRPDVALVDFHLRGGEESSGLIARLREQGVPVIVLSGSFGLAPLPRVEGATFLEKPVGEAELLAHLTPLIARKAALLSR
jgi:DNA-binding response OmpR family regulator